MEDRYGGATTTPHSASLDNFTSDPTYSNGRTSPQDAAIPNSTSYPSSLRNYNDSGFQHNNTRATLPNDYKHNDFRVKSPPNGWADNRGSRTLDRLPHRPLPVPEPRTDPTQRVSRVLENDTQDYTRLSRTLERSNQRSRPPDTARSKMPARPGEKTEEE